MKTVGTRKQPELALRPSGELLKAGALFNESVARLAPSTFIPKGIYRFKSHEEANKHEQECIAQGMAAQARNKVAIK